MELNEIWLWYCGERFPNLKELPEPVPVSPWRAVELFWQLHPLFTPRMDAINATRYETAFDDEADGALAQMAIADSFDGWEALSAGAWRVLAERLLYAQTVALANEKAGNPVIAHLPRGLDEQSQVRALTLEFLLGGARTIDRRLLRTGKNGELPWFPAGQTLRKQ